jgi:hypothetical protein
LHQPIDVLNNEFNATKMSECYVREDANPYHSWSANRNEWKALYMCYGREDTNPYHSW